MPIVPLHHLHSHFGSEKEYPYICLVSNSTHTEVYCVRGFYDIEIIGLSIDISLGQAFETIWKALDLKTYNIFNSSDIIPFPIPMLHHAGFDFSFEGITYRTLQHMYPR